MLNFLKKSCKNVFAFMKPRAILCAVLLIATVLSSLILFGKINAFVIKYDDKTETVYSLNAGVHNALCCAGIDGSAYKVENAVSVGGKTIVSLIKTFSVYITSGGETVKVGASENDTVEAVLDCAGFKVDEYDMVEPALTSVVSENTYIDYVNIDYVSGSYTQAVPYSIDTVYSDSMEQGKSATAAGKDGLEQINYTQKIVDGEVVETSVDGKVTLLAAQNAVKTVGTRRVSVTTSASVSAISQLNPSSPVELDENGNPVSYKKHVTVQATAYTYTGHNCATGVAPKPGYIAVNPKVIPYGTKMYIKSSDGKYVYGYAVAADTGGFVKTHPTNVDLFFPTVSSMNTFGRRNVEIYILD